MIAGDGPLRPKLQQELAKRNLASRVTFTGSLPHEEIPAVIRQFDVAVAPYPPPQHAFYFSPLKLFEYMACGVPVVAPNLGQIAEVMRHGETGLLYRSGDLEGLAECCHQLLENGALRRHVGKAGADQVAAQFTWDHNARRTVEVAWGLRERAAAVADRVSGGQGCGRNEPAGEIQ